MSRRGVDYKALAEASGLTRSGIYKIVEGLRWPSPDNLDRIAEALGLEPADLIRPEDESIPEVKRQLMALIRGMDENEAAWALEALDVLLRGLRGQPLRPADPAKKVKDR